MVTPLPSTAALTTPPSSHAAMRTNFANLRAFLAGLLGDDGLGATALTTLGTLLASHVTAAAATTVLADNRGKLFNCTGTWALTLPSAATAGAGWCIVVRNAGSGTITVTPPAPTLIDGAATLQLFANRSIIIACSGADFFSMPLFPNKVGAQKILGNNTAAVAAPKELTPAQVAAMLPLFTATAAGQVPASVDSASKFLRGDGVWADPQPFFLDTEFFLRSGANMGRGAYFSLALQTNFSRTYLLPNVNDALLARSDIAPISNKTIDLALNTVSGAKSDFDTALTDDNFLFEASDQTVSGKKTFSGAFVLAALASNPPTPEVGQIWHDGATGHIKAYVGSESRILDGQAAIPMLVPPTGEYVQTTVGCGGDALSTAAGAVNRIDLYPYIPRADMTIVALAVNCTTAVASALGKFVIYDSDALGRPTTLLSESATVDLSTTGVKEAALSINLRAGHTYWLGFRHSSTASISTWPTAATPDINGGAPTTAARKSLRRSRTFATAAAANWVFTSADIYPNPAPAIWAKL
ncbi:hypothetical protein ACTTAI_13395 [Rhodobacter capsulatus]|uniref:hypothetical protein n=1 Tax=Rhodobacter capsulatus TaxID=1061 RepID=UPI004028E334